MKQTKSSRVRALLQIAFAFCAASIVVRLAWLVIFDPFYEGDSRTLVTANVPAVRACLAQGKYIACPNVGPLPLFQFVPALVLNFLNFSSAAILHSLAYISFLSFAASLVLVFLTLRKKTSPPLAVLGVLVMITGPLLWYSHSTYGEMAGAFFTLAFGCAAILRRSPWQLAILFVLAGLTKEIAAPFLLLIGFVALLPEAIAEPRQVKSSLWALVIGAAVSVAVNGAFNYFRFGTFYNAGYLLAYQIVPTWKLQLSFFAGLWFSPSGGLAFFWTSFVVLYSAVAAIVLFGRRRKNRKKRLDSVGAYLALALIFLMLFLLTLGFAKWFAPFGWLAWGPRLILPWIPATVMLLLWCYPVETSKFLALLLRKRFAFVLTAALLLFVALPQFVVVLRSIILADIFNPTAACPRWPPIQDDLPLYYRCLKSVVWPEKFVLLEAFRLALEPSAVFFSICYCVTVIGCCSWIRTKLLEGKVA